jgi:alpha-beta hydrolase superfamily lysophospholipase
MTVTIEPPDIEAVWRRWEPRFIAAGVDANIVARLKSEVSTWDAWEPAWRAAAADLEEAAEAAYARDRLLTAGELWASASVIHHFGGMYLISDPARFAEAHDRATATFRRAAPLLSPPAHRIVGRLGDAELVGYLRVPVTPTPPPVVDPPAVRFTATFDGVELACYLRVPAGRAKPPVVMLFNGFEGTKEESNQRVSHLLERGLATLSWDGPGRGETWSRLPMTGDYGPAAGAMIDALEQRGDVDATRVGALGPNRGGFLAAKAAASEPRIRGLAVTSPGYDRRLSDWKTAYEEAFFCHLFHVDSAEELTSLPAVQAMTLEGEAANIGCPTLIVAGDRDQGAQFEGSQRLFAEISGEKEWAVVKGSERNGNNVPYIVRPLMADFLAEHLVR